jgi:magnesium chelatase subunit D
MNFPGVVGQEEAALALILNAVDHRCGGVILVGEKGCGKSTLARSFGALLADGKPFVELPLNATEDALLGNIDIEDTLAAGRAVHRRGLLGRAGGGALYIDDVNLLSPEITALVLKGQDGALEREDGSGAASRYMLIASMNPEEGALSVHFLDRFGMCVPMQGLKDAPGKVAVMKGAMRDCTAPGGGKSEHYLPEKVKAARTAAAMVAMPPETMDYLVRQCLDNCIAGHRGDIHLYYAARAYAAFTGAASVAEDHVDRVLPLVLVHRRRLLREPPEEAPAEPERQSSPDKNERGEEKENPEDETNRNRSDCNAGDHDLKDERSGRPRESKAAEEIFSVGRTFKVRRLAFRKDRMNRDVPGRRTKTGSRGKRGRHVKSILRANGDVAVDATIRAAAPFQKLRGRKEMLIIRDEDLRYRQREKRMGHLVVFVVDGSGSMGAKRRMAETKGAVQSLLIDCYQKRDMVSMVVFRKDRAEVVLPPTASVDAAAKRLRDIPVGGKTPLAAGLLEAFNLIRRARAKSAETRFLAVIVTDGRANQTISPFPVDEELAKVTNLLRGLPATDFIVVDTEDKNQFIRTDLACKLSAALDADYYEMDALQADYLTAVVREKKASAV